MAWRRSAGAAVAAAAVVMAAGCASPLDQVIPARGSSRAQPEMGGRVAPAEASAAQARPEEALPELSSDSTPEEFVRYALLRSAQVASAHQRWAAATERPAQARALPDPRLSVGVFLDEVETRTGPQQARIGVQQTFPWMGKLADREDAASRAAMAAWRELEAARLAVTERVRSALHDLAYLDAATRITDEHLGLLRSFEEVVRARYRVGAGSHPELIRVQVELGQMEDRLAQLRAMRPSFVAELNAALNREASAPIGPVAPAPGLVATTTPEALIAAARRSNPGLLAIDERVGEERALAEVARKDGLPDVTLGLDYTFTGEAMNSSIPESGDDPIMLTVGINVPLWREKYEAGVREAVARRLALAYEREDAANRLGASIARAWFEHIDADRRVRLFRLTLTPKAEESLRASLAGFRAGETSFLDLLDTERTLLEFAVAAERARADRGKALARLDMLVGEPTPTGGADETTNDTETDGAQP